MDVVNGCQIPREKRCHLESLDTYNVIPSMQISICMLDLWEAFFPVLSKKVGLLSLGWLDIAVSVEATEAESSSLLSPTFFDLRQMARNQYEGRVDIKTCQKLCTLGSGSFLSSFRFAAHSFIWSKLKIANADIGYTDSE